MMPIGDDNSGRRTLPIVNYVLIALNVLVFFLEISGGEPFVMNWSFIPARFLADPMSNMVTLFTSMFMHAGLAHLFGNMLYLWIFGDNIEDYLGKIFYPIFYVACGLAATASQLFMDPISSVPNLGASGAIAGVLGGYMYLLPNAKVDVLLGRSLIQLPALLVIGFWFAVQFISQIGTFASTSGEEGGVAYMAHIGGFVAGLAIIFVQNRFLPHKRS